MVLWDNGNDFFDRNARTWRDPTVKDIIIAAAAGKVNTIPEVISYSSLVSSRRNSNSCLICRTEMQRFGSALDRQ